MLSRSKLLCENMKSLRRLIHTGPKNFISEKNFQKLKLKQARMQCGDGVPVYLKYGLRDRILYRLTVALLVYTTFQSLRTLLELNK